MKLCALCEITPKHGSFASRRLRKTSKGGERKTKKEKRVQNLSDVFILVTLDTFSPDKIQKDTKERKRQDKRLQDLVFLFWRLGGKT